MSELDIVQRLRYTEDGWPSMLMNDAADTIEELRKEVERLNMITCMCIQNSQDAGYYRWLRESNHNWYVGPSYYTYNDIVVEGEYINYSGNDLDNAIHNAMEAQ